MNGEKKGIQLPYPNEHACRLRQPGDFKAGSFRRTTRKHDGKEYSVIMGRLKDGNTMTEQAYRYPKTVWTESSAKSHCADHGGSFEAAIKAGTSLTEYAAIKKFTARDAEKFKKGLTDTQKEKWVAAANTALTSCLVSGGSQMECEIAAIRQANSLFSKNRKKSETRYLAGDQPEEVDGKRIITKLRLTLGQADIDGDYQMVLPIGAFHSAYYGEIIITPTFCRAMLINWKNQVLGNRRPFIDTLHDRGRANGWIEDLQVGDDGLYALISWTRMGEENVREGYFKFFSADIGEVTDIESGDRVWPVLIAVALCNTPVMNRMPPAHLAEDILQGDHDVSDTSFSEIPAHGDGDKLTDEELKMDVQTLIERFNELDETQQREFIATLPPACVSTETETATSGEAYSPLMQEIETLATVVGDLKATILDVSSHGEKDKEASLPAEEGSDADKLEAKVAALEKTNEQLTDYVKELRKQSKDKQKSDVLNTALEAGKIRPRDKAFWEEQFDRDPEMVSGMLAKIPDGSVFETRGTGDGGAEKEAELTEEDRAVMRKLGLSEEDMKKFGGSVKFPGMTDKE